MIYMALPADDPARPVVCNAAGDATGAAIPRWVKVFLQNAHEDGLSPGSYIALWTDYPGAGVRVADYIEPEPDRYDLDALWASAEVLP